MDLERRRLHRHNCDSVDSWDIGGREGACASNAAYRKIGDDQEPGIAGQLNRFAHGKPDTLASLAAELVRQDPDVIVADRGQAALAAKSATQRIPIVMGAVGDPVKICVVASLARPGTNVTGLTLLSVELSSRRLHGIHAIRPPGITWRRRMGAARVLGVELAAVEARGASDLDSALEAVAAERRNGLISLADATLWNRRRRVVDFASRKRIPGRART
jgi:putative ABC transport system substrate-binding protein